MMSFKKLPANYLVAYTYLLIATIIWAIAIPTIKMTLQYIPPFTFLFLRFLIVGVILLPYTIYKLQSTKIDKRDLPVFLMLGLFAQSSLILTFMGLKYASAMDTALLGIMGTLLSMAAGHYFYNDEMNNGVKLGTLVTLIGALLISFEPLFLKNGSATPPLLRFYGNMLIVLSHISFLIYIIWIKISLSDRKGLIKKTLNFLHIRPFSKQYDQGIVTSLNFYVGLVSMVPFAFLESLGFLGRDLKHDFSNPRAVFGLVFMSFFSSIIAYFLFERAIKRVTITDSALMSYIQPFMTIPFAYLLLREIPNTYNIRGGIIMLIGVVIAEASSHHHLKLMRKKAPDTYITKSH